MWSVSLLEDPLELGQQVVEDPLTGLKLWGTRVAWAQCSLPQLLGGSSSRYPAFQEGGRVARVALADFVARALEHHHEHHHHHHHHHNEQPQQQQNSGSWALRWEPLHRTTMHNLSHYHTRRRRRNHRKGRNNNNSDMTLHPFMLERTDVVVAPSKNKNCGDGDGDDDEEEVPVLHVFVRFFVYDNSNNETTTAPVPDVDLNDATIVQALQEAATAALSKILDASPSHMAALMRHVATAVWQDRVRVFLKDKYDAVAFVANGAILPRKSGASTAPMASPPALAFEAPPDSPMARSVSVDMGQLHAYLVDSLPASDTATEKMETGDNNSETTTNSVTDTSTTKVTLEGLLVPRGVSLIVGGGYHGKSTLLRCLAAGVYNKIPGDGREFCVTVDDAVTVRAEDGRYVNKCNVSAFISNLPTPSLDTTQFSSGEASGSTSQAANVAEAIEMGASAFLVDEDTSAANYMARDGRMRSLVMDESITPLLYRVNGLFASKGISSVVVVGGVGDWLDVPHAVILMDRYRCKDATAKARSVSKQFSHGHVQYAGRGVVHRLDWPKSGTPIPRRPVVEEKREGDYYNYALNKTAVTLLEGTTMIALQQIADGNSESMSLDSSSSEGSDKNGYYDDDDDDEQYMDLSRCEQLMGKKPQLYGCGLGVAYLLQAARQHPELGLPDLLRKMDEDMDANGLLGLIQQESNGNLASTLSQSSLSSSWKVLVESLGCAYRPRRFEVGQALTRLGGIIMEPIPVEDDGSEAAFKAEAERKKQELLAIWNARRKNPLEQLSQQATAAESG